MSDTTITWEAVQIPHSARLEPLVITQQQWQGICYYKKEFRLDTSFHQKHITLLFEGVMHETEVYVNGELLKYNPGGYLPFVVDLSGKIVLGETNTIVLKVNNQDNSEIPPGKPINTLDFNYYGGIYRDVFLRIQDDLRISDPIEVDRVGAGGVFVSFNEVSKEQASVSVKVDIVNDRVKTATAKVHVKLVDYTGNVAANASRTFEVKERSFTVESAELTVRNPNLWSPGNPHLYTLVVELFDENALIEQYQERIGIRTFSFDSDRQLVLNGSRLYLRGTNRHQEYPYIGYALSNEANYRDAYKIKQAGFNFVRTAHYPPDPSFIDACDELGIILMNATPGWQFYGNQTFQDRVIQNIRTMIRRDRNHPSAMIWEASLNESDMPKEFILRANAAAKEELPLKDAFTSGWVDSEYDIFIPARQHAKPPEYWKDYKTTKAVLIAEYGDWEYYAQNAGFNQTAFKDLKDFERNSRQLRGDGEKRLLQQAFNFQEAHNSNLRGQSFGDANWLMFDYNRGYAPDLEASGIMDIFRIPKFAFYFYQSQQRVESGSSAHQSPKPMVEIASFLTKDSPTNVTVYSNCEEVALFINGNLVEKKKPELNSFNDRLNSPPFQFEIGKPITGSIIAQGFIGGKHVASDTVSTPAEAFKLELRVDLSNKPISETNKDVVFLYASITDEKGSIVPTASNLVYFEVSGEGMRLIGENPINAEAGIASIILETNALKKAATISATSPKLMNGKLEIKPRKK